MSWKRLAEEVQFTPGEIEIIEGVDTANTAARAGATTRAAFVAVHRLEEVADKIIASNTTTAEAHGRYAKALNWLTGALVVVSAVQAWLIWWGAG